jgi:arylsulfatase A-like enzyme
LVLVSGLQSLCACTEPAAYDLRRVSFAPVGTASSVLVAGDVSRMGVRLPAAQARAAVQLSGLTAGRIVLHLAPAGPAAYGGAVRVSLREVGWRGLLGLGVESDCELRWGSPGTATDVPWSSCVLELPRSVAEARVEIARRDGAAGELLVSDLRVEGRARSALPPVFVLVLDAARFDQLRPFRADAAFGEHLQALAADSVVLRELRSSSSWTRPAVASLFTGLRADRHRVHGRGDRLADDFVTLAEILRERGWATAAWSANPNVLPLWGFGQGFDAFVDQGSRAWIRIKTDGAELVDRLRAALAARGPESGFYYLHMMDPHAPYLPSAEQRGVVDELPGVTDLFPRPLAIVDVPRDWKAFRDYLGELLDVDQHVGAFVDLLRDEGLYDEALIVVVADHGEEFLDHGGRDHGRTLYEEVLHVPGLIKLPGNRYGGRVFEAPVSFEDLAPTMLDVLGLPIPEGIDGRALALGDAQAPAPRPHVATLRLDGRVQRSIVDPPWKLVQFEGIGMTLLFDLAEDPRERRNLAGVEPEIAERLDALLTGLLQRDQQGWHVLVCGTLEESRAHLLLRAPGAEVAFRGFEPDEVQPGNTTAGSWLLQPLLRPTTLSREALVRAEDAAVADHAEVVIVAHENGDEPVFELEAADGSAIVYLLGAGDTPASARHVEVTAKQADVSITAAARIDCDSQHLSAVPARAFVRIWYVAPAESIDDEELDPVLRERMRALGYLD